MPEAARLSGTGLNTQHWLFILVDNKQNLKTLAEDSTSGSSVRGANFAIIVLTNPEYNFHLISTEYAVGCMESQGGFRTIHRNKGREISKRL